MRARHLAVFTPWAEDPEAVDLVPTADDWAAHAGHVIDTVGPDHVGIGLDLGGRGSCVPLGIPRVLISMRSWASRGSRNAAATSSKVVMTHDPSGALQCTGARVRSS
jgi:microsomal dipeptidase-like Zn-dependent dipeptidase